jgi:hypothetical protein
MRIPSGTTDQYIYFVAVDATDLKTRETGLSSFTVYRSRNGAAAAAFTTPTINETDTTNMPGVYELLCDEDMTIGSGNTSEEMVFHITHSGMAPVTRTIELYRPLITEGETLTVSSGAATVGTNNDKTGYRLSATGVDDVWDEPQSGHTTAGTFGKYLDDEISDTKTQVAAIEVDTQDIQSRLPAALTADGNIKADTLRVGGTLQTAGDIIGDTNDIQARLPAALTADGNIKADTLRVGGTLQTAGDIIADTNDIQSRLPAALVGGRIDASVGAMAADTITATAIATGAIDALALATDAVDEIAAAILITPANKLLTNASGRVDVYAVGGDTTTVTNMVRTFRSLIIDTMTSGSSTTSLKPANLVGSVADQYKGRIITFRDDTTTAALRGQQTDITASTLASPTTLTCTALTTAPASGDTFTIN